MDKKEKIQILQKLININSVNGNELEVSKFIGKLLDKEKIQYKIDAFDDKRANLIAEIGSKKNKKVLCLTGHQDTVSILNEKSWKYNPFSAKIVGDKLYGRGSADMKSGLAAEIIALIELANENFPISGTVRFIATAGEEYGTPGANRLNKKNAVKDVSAMVVGEPTSEQIIYAHSGSINYKIESYGKAWHSSEPQKGKNAILGLTKYINAEKNLFNKTPKDKFLGLVQHSITMIKGGSQVNIIPDYAELYGNIRPTVSFDNDKILNLINNKIDEINNKSPYKLKLSLIHNFHPVETNPKNDFVQLVKKTANETVKKHRINLETMNGATDASVFIQKNPKMSVVILGPDKWSLAHQINEYTNISSFLETIEIYKKIITNFFKK